MKKFEGEGLRVLLVDDEEKIRELLSKYLQLDGHRVETAASAEAARNILEAREFDVVVTDLRMEGAGGLGLLAWLQEAGPSVPALVISAYSDIADAVEAMRRGAFDYLVKPFEPGELSLRIAKAVRSFRLERSLRIRTRLEAQQGSSGSEADSTGSESGEGAEDLGWRPRSKGLLESANAGMRNVLAIARKAAPSTASILIGGESGTGKEVLAAWIHGLSDRSGKPFVPVNLGGIPEGFLETELFGHEKGAFTGAERRKTGMFELANGGTLFLDEIGDMPLHLQVKLLRVLQDRRIQRLGATKGLPIDIRIIAASHRNLSQLVREGKFREDLLYRLNVIPLQIPPLRERPEDIPSLAAFIMEKHLRPGRAGGISADALDALGNYAFPGNIRELENMLERALILCDGPVLRERDFGLGERSGSDHPRGLLASIAASIPDSDAPSPVGADPEAAPLPGATLADIERWAILREFALQDGRRQAIADTLGISRRTLLNKLVEYGVQEE
jgi:two-component system response regulator AtoC